MRIVAISDTHGQHEKATVPEGDVLIHAGDFMVSGWVPAEITDFNNWLGRQPHKHKIVIAGNHDWMFERQRAEARALLTNAIYLEDSGVYLDDFTFWGSPYQPEFMNWAFNVPRGAALQRHWDLIPKSLDVLITHGPPFGIGDWSHFGNEHAGCEDLAETVRRIEPQLHVFGHIHGGAGTCGNGVTKYVNASFLSEAYRPLYPPTVIDLERPRGRSIQREWCQMEPVDGH